MSEKGQMRKGESMKSLLWHMEEYGLEPASNEALLKSFKIHSGLHPWKMDSSKLLPEAKEQPVI